MLLPGIDSNEVVSLVAEVACVAVRACARVSVIFLPSGGTFGLGPLRGANSFGLILNEADINSALWSLELINVPDGHTCGPA